MDIGYHKWMKAKYFLFLLSALFLLFGCGKTKKYTTTDISFNFKSNINATSPQRFVLFAHNQFRLEKARVLVPGSNNLTLPNGLWKFSVIGFEDTISSSSDWPIPVDLNTNTAYCGFTDYDNFNGTAKTIDITVSKSLCNQQGFTNSNVISVVGESGSNYYHKWILPFGDRGNINNDNGEQETFTTICFSNNNSERKIYFPRNLTDPKKLPYFLILRLYTDTSCSVELGEIHFDGDLFSPPVKKWSNISRPQSSLYIRFGTNTANVITITIPAYP
jgi:hypothetical protein